MGLPAFAFRADTETTSRCSPTVSRKVPIGVTMVLPGTPVTLNVMETRIVELPSEVAARICAAKAGTLEVPAATTIDSREAPVRRSSTDGYTTNPAKLTTKPLASTVCWGACRVPSSAMT